MKHSATLTSAAQGHTVIQRLWEWAKPRLQDGKPLVLSIEEQRRSLPQNKLLHARIGDIASRREWAGRKQDAVVWKRLLVAAWMRARGQQVMLLPALDGAGVDIVFQPTHRLSKAECADLLDWIDAWDAGT